MRYLEKIITETKNKKAKENLLVLQRFNENANKNQKIFIDVMMGMCGTNKYRYPSNVCSISIGKKLDDNVFVCFLNSIISEPIVVPSHYEEDSHLIVRDKHNTVVTFNLSDVDFEKVEINNIGNNVTRYLFYLHSQYVNLDYKIDMVLEEVA